MAFKNIFEDFNLNRQDSIYIFILFLYSLIIVSIITFNPNKDVQLSDVIIYMFNALKLAGCDYNNLANPHHMYLSPIYCFLISIIVRFGIDVFMALKYLGAFFAILGNISMYLLLKSKFNSIIAFTGSFIFSSSTNIFISIRNAGVDIPALTLSIITILFLMVAINKHNYKFYILSAISLIFAIFTRYTALFMIPIIILYFFSKHNFFRFIDESIYNHSFFNNCLKLIKKTEFKYIFTSIILFSILFYLISRWIVLNGSGLTFISQSTDSISGFSHRVKDIYYNPDNLYFLKNFSLIFLKTKIFLFGISLSKIIFSISSIGFLLIFANLLRNRNTFNRKFIVFKTKNFRKLLFIIFLICILISILGFKISHLITNMFLLIGLTIFVSLFKENDSVSFLIYSLGWGLVYFVFFSFIDIKMNRYIITVFPSVVIVLMWGFQYFYEKIASFNKYLPYMITVILILLITLSSFNYIENMPYRHDLDEINDISNFIISYDGDYKDKSINADSYNRFYKWMLQKDVKYIKGDDLSNSDYLIVKNQSQIDNYTKIYSTKTYSLFERIQY